MPSKEAGKENARDNQHIFKKDIKLVKYPLNNKNY